MLLLATLCYHRVQVRIAKERNASLRSCPIILIKTVMMFWPEYDKIRPEIHVRISELPVSDNLRDIRQIHLNALIKVTGVVTRRTAVFPQLKV